MTTYRQDAGSATAGITSAFVVATTIVAAVAGFGVALGEVLVRHGWMTDEGRVVVLDAGVGGLVVGVVFAVAGVVTWVLVRRFRMPRSPWAAALLIGLAVALLGSAIGLLVIAVRPALWPSWPLDLVPAVLAGVAAAVIAARELARPASRVPTPARA
ncbi:hypothetical protein [Herbiconiux solani]|uniref:hypothetical protein n=1 Tax=Herbiconiux solani TaxID=661329 RepID=UPI000825DDF3|nr:hypothetical protein [Herbiconiux solani]